MLTCSGRTVRLWSLPPPDGVVLHTAGLGWVRSIAFSPDGKSVLTGDGEPEAAGAGRLWDGFTGKLIGSPLIHKNLVLKTAYSPDSQTIATAGAGGRGPTGGCGPDSQGRLCDMQGRFTSSSSVPMAACYSREARTG